RISENLLRTDRARTLRDVAWPEGRLRELWRCGDRAVRLLAPYCPRCAGFLLARRAGLVPVSRQRLHRRIPGGRIRCLWKAATHLFHGADPGQARPHLAEPELAACPLPSGEDPSGL